MSIKGLIAVVKVYGRGRIQIPSEVRKELGIKDDDKVCFLHGLDGNIYIKKVESQVGIRYQTT